MPRRWSASFGGTPASTPANTSAGSPTGIPGDLPVIYLSGGSVRDGLAEDFSGPVRLVFGQHERRRDLQDVTADVVHHHAQLPGAVDHLRGQSGVAIAGGWVDKLQPDRQPAAADVADPVRLQPPEFVLQRRTDFRCPLG